MQNFKLERFNIFKQSLYYTGLIVLLSILALYEQYFYIFIIILQAFFIFLVFQNNNLKPALLSKSTGTFKILINLIAILLFFLLLFNFQNLDLVSHWSGEDLGLEKVSDIKIITCLVILFFALIRGLTRNKFW